MIQPQRFREEVEIEANDDGGCSSMVDPPTRRAVEAMTYYVYILRSDKDNKLYVGFTRDLRKRMKSHSSGINKSTAPRRPLKLMYYEAYSSEKDARQRERFLKTGRGHEVLYHQLRDTLG